MDPWKFAVIWLLPGAVFFVLGMQEWWRGRWRAPTYVVILWLLLVLLLGPFFFVGLIYFRSRN